jgi:kumamolisin
VAFAAALIATCGTAVASPVRSGATSAPSPPSPGQLGGSSSSSWWQQFLKSSKDLGPSKANRASVIIDLDADASAAIVEKWATHHHLSIEWYAGHAVAVFSATPARLGAALRVSINDYRSPQGQLFYSATRQPSVPGALAHQIDSIGRLSDYKGYHDDYVPAGGLTPTGLVQAYDATELRAQGINGAGETVVALEIDGYTLSDLDAFTKKFGLAAFSTGNFIVNGGEAGKPQGESNMDLETIREIAPGARIVYYNLAQDTSAKSFSQLLLDGFTRVSKLYPGAIWTLSLGSCEKYSAFADLNAENEVALQAEDHGSTVFASSGDTAGLECVPQGKWGSAPTQSDVGVSNPAVLPGVTGVGGTLLSVTTSGAYAGETTWFYPVLNNGTSGGQSYTIAQPSWQVGSGLPTPTDREPRLVPDVSADGDPNSGNADHSGGAWGLGGGTSLSSPIWAAFTALIDQYLHQKGKPAVGFFNPALYYIAGHAQAYPPFHPVTTGGNEVWRNGAGYNESTGLGSPDVYNLARDILTYEGSH